MLFSVRFRILVVVSCWLYSILSNEIKDVYEDTKQRIDQFTSGKVAYDPLITPAYAYVTKSDLSLSPARLSTDQFQELTKAVNAFRLSSSLERDQREQFLRFASDSDIIQAVQTRIAIQESRTFRNYLTRVVDKIIDSVPVLPFDEFKSGPLFTENVVKAILTSKRDPSFIFLLSSVLPDSKLDSEGQHLITVKVNEEITNMMKRIYGIDAFIEKTVDWKLENAWQTFQELEKQILIYEQKVSQDLKSRDIHDESRNWENVALATRNLGSELAQAGRLRGSNDLVRIGLTIGSMSTIGVSLAQLGAFKMSGITATTGFSTVFPALAICGATLSVFSAFGGGDGDGGQALQAIMDAITTLREEMHEQFYHVHKEIFEVYEYLNRHHHAISLSINELKETTKFAIAELSNLMRLDLSTPFLQIKHSLSMNFVPRDATQFRKDLDDLQLFTLVISKQESFNGGNLVDSKLIQAADQLGARPATDNIDFYVNFAHKQLEVKELAINTDVLNPRVFYQGALPIINLILLCIQNDVNNPDDLPLLDSKNLNVVTKLLKTLKREHSKISNIRKFLREKAIARAFSFFISEVNDLSKLVENKLFEYSNSLNNHVFQCNKAEQEKFAQSGVTCSQDGKCGVSEDFVRSSCFSVFNPDYKSLYAYYHLEFSNHNDICFISADVPFLRQNKDILQLRYGFKSQHRCAAMTYNKLSTAFAIYKNKWGIPHSQRLGAEGAIIDIDSDEARTAINTLKSYVNQVFSPLRQTFVSSIRNLSPPHLKRIELSLKMLNGYATIINRTPVTNSTIVPFETYFSNLDKMPIDSAIPLFRESSFTTIQKIYNDFTAWNSQTNGLNFDEIFLKMIESCEMAVSLFMESRKKSHAK